MADDRLDPASPNSVAPYPRSAEEATVERLVRHFIVAGLTASDDFHNGGAAAADHGVRLIHEIVTTFTSVVLLRALREHAPQVAEEVARWLWAAWGDGSVPSEHLWGLLDAEGLTTAFERMREARHRRRKEAARG